MIDPKQLSNNDIGRDVIYKKDHPTEDRGKLSSWNYSYIFVRFLGPCGEACLPEDVEFTPDPVEENA